MLETSHVAVCATGIWFQRSVSKLLQNRFIPKIHVPDVSFCKMEVSYHLKEKLVIL